MTNMSTVLDSPPDQIARLASRVLTGLAALVILVSLISSFSVIAPGNTGVIFNIWTGSLRSVPQGMAWRMPWITQVQSYPTALRTYTMVRRSQEGSSHGRRQHRSADAGRAAHHAGYFRDLQHV